jgi:integrase
MINDERQTEWRATNVQNIVRYAPSGTLFARFKIGGKLIRRSLKTNVVSVAKLRLADMLKEHRGDHQTKESIRQGRMNFSDGLEIHLGSIDADPSLKPATKIYWRRVMEFIEKSWPEALHRDVRKFSEADLRTWLTTFSKRYAPTVVNNSIGAMRAIFNVAVEQGARFNNPAQPLKRVPVRPKNLTLPSRQQFLEFVAVIENGGSRDSKNCADLVRFMAYSGMRVGESKHVTWADVDLIKQKLHVRGDPETGTKNSESRIVPLIPELQTMLAKMRVERADEPPLTPIMRVHECQNSMDRAAKIVGMARITHHDLRHLFATICIESGVDVPTVSRWLGHKDGGALAMKTYGHLRDEHSAAQASRVSFSTPVVQAE